MSKNPPTNNPRPAAPQPRPAQDGYSPGQQRGYQPATGQGAPANPPSGGSSGQPKK